ncbi:endocuticle structural glycoprotein SgAbd-8 [Schistocerca gregaria]|uniref:endocuticle structural glycoprotein SgAbd-8 n=1 Tax=Schistocerca gregaria TaxID=7010 RepID=UPI00211DF672|nr:endocuticle structural glycoprotein SgAbd-8 [Schistocerca gregaria]
MRILVVLAIVASCAVAQRGPLRGQPQPLPQYPEDDGAQPQPFSAPQPSPRAIGQPQPDPRPRDERYTTPIPIVRFDKEQSADGSYKTSYETGNNIVAEETGFLKNVGDKETEALVQHGSYSYTAPDGSLITITYTADEQGFRAEGSHIPTPPPVPEEIQKSLDLIYAGIKQQQEEEARNPKFQQNLADGALPEEPDNYPTPSRFRQ